jgi:tRNA(adenine34) deaminase
MRLALEAAKDALFFDEVPVGAVVIFESQIVATGFNRTRIDLDPSAHAEVVAIREAAKKIGNYRLTGMSLYTTIEPCAMCAGLIVWARLKRLVYGARDVKSGAVDSIFQICTNPALNHRVEVTSGVLEVECRALIQGFFRDKRTVS